MTLATFWLISATLALILLTYQDIKNKMVVDDRRNFFLSGMTFALLGVYTKGLLWLLGVIAITIFVMLSYGFANKKGWVGSADVNSLSWITMGLMICNPIMLAVFFLALAVVSILTMVFKSVTKYKDALPFYPNIMAAWVIALMLVRVTI